MWFAVTCATAALTRICIRVPGHVGDRFGGDAVGDDLDRGGQGRQAGVRVDADLQPA